MRLYREHFSLDGGVRRARGHAQPGADPARPDHLGRTFAALDYGAVTCQLKTDFDGCMRVLDEVVRAHAGLSFELGESVPPRRPEDCRSRTAGTARLAPPDHIIVPGGNLGNSWRSGNALLKMKELGLISSLPKLSVIQAEGANALVRTMRETGGKKLISVHAETMATAIRIGSPASWKKAVRVLEATGGAVEQVSEVEIALAKAEIGADGIGCEPASAVTLAGLKKLVQQGFVKKNESVVLILTGNLLKDPDFTLKFHRGDLFAGTEQEEEAAAVLSPRQRAPMVLDASANAVVKALEYAEQMIRESRRLEGRRWKHGFSRARVEEEAASAAVASRGRKLSSARCHSG